MVSKAASRHSVYDRNDYRSKKIELFRNKRQGKLSSKKAMEGAKQWVYASETTVR
jgi:hypothetical protein